MVKKLTILVPAFNEEVKLGKTLDEILSIAKRLLEEFEVIVIDDGSTDDTAKVSQLRVEKFPSVVSLLRHSTNLGVGASYAEGLAKANYPFITLIPGDNAFAATGVERLFQAVGRADLIVSYRSNPAARTTLRRWLSRLATVLIRGVSGRGIRDAHSMYVFPVALAREINVSSGYSYHMESLCHLLLRVETFIEIPVELNPKPDASSGVMKFKTIANLGMAMLRLYALRFTGQLTKKN